MGSKRSPTKADLVQEIEQLRERLRAMETGRIPKDGWESVFQAIGHPTVILDAAHGIVAVNMALERLLGKCSEELRGLKCWEIFHGPTASGAPDQCPFERMAASGTCETVEMEMEAFGGTYLVSCTPMLDENGRIEKIIHIATDVTDRKRAQEALRYGTIELESILDATADGILAVDREGKVLHANRRFAALWRIPQTLLDRKDDRALLEFVLDQLCEPEAFLRKVEALYLSFEEDADTLLFKDGRVFERSSYPLLMDGKIIGRVWSFSDMTARERLKKEREKLEAQLAQAQKMEAVGRLAGGVAHDFNNLLQGMLGYLELTLDDLPQDSPMFTDLVEVQKAAKSAVELTRQLLAFGRRQSIRIESVDLNNVVDGTMNMLRRIIGEDIDLDFVLGGALGAIEADPSQIQQVLLNLCVNARDAMPNGGRITIETASASLDADYCAAYDWAKPGRYVLLKVTDSGCGMTPETLQRVFDPFFTTKEMGKGTGLGLATVYGIVRQHEGIVQVYSEPGNGSIFKVYLPVREGGVALAEEEHAGPVRGGDETILLAEDEEQVRHLAQRVLEGAGYRVVAATDGEEALRLYDEFRWAVDLLVLDVIMPKKNGGAVLDEIRRERPEMRCLFASGYSENVLQNNAILQQGFHLLEKPYGRESLLRAVRDVLDK